MTIAEEEILYYTRKFRNNFFIIKDKNQIIRIRVQNMLKIFITDNGKGFDSSLILKENGVNYGHFGLYNMKERAKDIGAAIEIISEEGEGTEIKLEVPLK